VTRARLGLLQVCLAGVLWGTGGLAVTFLHDREGLGALTVSAWRMAIAAVALISFACAAGRFSQVMATVRRHPGLVVLTGLGTAAYQGLYFLSVLMAGVTVSTVVALGLAPVLATAWEHTRERTRPTARESAVLAGALTGLVLISVVARGGSAAPQDRPVLGIVLAVAAGATYAATTVLGHHLASRVDPLALTTGATVAGALALSPFFILAAATRDPVGTTDPVSLLALLYLGVATMAVAYGLLYAGLRTTPGSAATVATLVEPLSAAVLAVALLDERLPWPAWLGGALILWAVGALRPRTPPGAGR